MKKIVLLMLVIAGSLWAEVEIERFLKVKIPYDFFSDYCGSEASSLLPESCKIYIDKRFVSPISWCSDYVCNSVLDSRIFFSFYDGSMSSDYYVLQYYVFSGATVSLIDVIRDEFTNFQRCNFLCTSDEKLDSLFNEMDRSLAPGLQTKLNLYEIDKKTHEGRLTYSSYDVYGNIYDVLDSLNASQSVPYGVYFAAGVRAENGRLVVPQGLEGREFLLLNLKGRALRKGNLRNNMLLPREPSILRVKGTGDVYLK